MLNYGLDFVPFYKTKTVVENLIKHIKNEQVLFQSRLNYRIIFQEEKDNTVPPMYVPSGVLADSRLDTLNFYVKVNREINLKFDLIKKQNPFYNKLNFKPLYDFAKRKDVIIKPADKNLGTVILSFDQYITEVKRQLNSTSYKIIDEIPIDELKNRYNTLSDQVKHWFGLMYYKFLCKHKAKENFTIPIFYLTIKIHKTPWKGRPIIASNCWITTPFSIMVAHFLDCVLRKYGKNFVLINSESLQAQLTEHIQTNPLNTNHAFRTADVEDMYTNLQHTQVLENLNYFKEFDLNTPKPVFYNNQWDVLIQCVKFVLKCNYFREPTLGLFLQTVGIAMGSNFSPQIANLTVLRYEFDRSRKINPYSGSLPSPLFFRRYIDDIFEIVDLSQTLPASPYPSNLKLTYKGPNLEAEFLDLKIIITDNKKLIFKTHQKTMNSYQYPHFNSNIPINTKKGFIKGELIRYRRTCSNRKDFEYMKSIFMSRLLNRGYGYNFVFKIFLKVPWILKPKYINHDLIDIPKTIPLYFKIPFDSRIANIFSIKRILLNNWNELPAFFKKLTPITCYTIQKKLISKVVHADYTLLHKTIENVMPASVRADAPMPAPNRAEFRASVQPYVPLHHTNFQIATYSSNGKNIDFNINTQKSAFDVLMSPNKFIPSLTQVKSSSALYKLPLTQHKAPLTQHKVQASQSKDHVDTTNLPQHPTPNLSSNKMKFRNYFASSKPVTNRYINVNTNVFTSKSTVIIDDIPIITSDAKKSTVTTESKSIITTEIIDNSTVTTDKPTITTDKPILTERSNLTERLSQVTSSPQNKSTLLNKKRKPESDLNTNTKHFKTISKSTKND